MGISRATPILPDVLGERILNLGKAGVFRVMSTQALSDRFKIDQRSEMTLPWDEISALVAIAALAMDMPTEILKTLDEDQAIDILQKINNIGKGKKK